MSYVNHKIKSAFIHVAKNAGSTLSSFEWNRGSGHNTYVDLAKQLDDIEEYFTWGFVRNPWARAVSAYEDCPELHEFVPSFDIYVDRLYQNKHIFHDAKYITWGGGRQLEGIPIGRIHFWPSHLCLQNKHGEISVDYIGRVESIKQDLKYICDRLNVEYKDPPKRNCREGKQNRKNSYYKDLYTNTTINQIGDIFKNDIDLFKYEY